MPKLDATILRGLRLDVAGTPRDALAVKGAGFAWEKPLLDWRVGEALPAGSTFSRASTATYVDANGDVQTAAAGVMRDAHYIGGERTVLLEGARTNLLWPGGTGYGTGDGWGNWAAFSGAALVRTTGQADPQGGTGACRMTTTGGTSILKVVTGTATVPATGVVWSGRIWIRALGRPVLVFSNQSGQSRYVLPGEGWVYVTWSVTGDGTGVPQFQLRATNDAGNTTDKTKDVDALVFHPQYEAGAFSSSFVPGQTTRSADVLSLPFPRAPQGMTVYVRHVEAGAAHGGASAVLWAAGASPARVQMQGAAGSYTLVHNNGATSTSRSYTAPPLGALHEAASILFANGKVNVEHATNGGASTVVIGSSAIGLAGAWTVGQFSPGSVNSGAPGEIAFTHVIVAPGVRTLAAMRIPAGT